MGVPLPQKEPCQIAQYSRCYKYVNSPKSFSPAEQDCNSIGGHLLSIQNGFENGLVAGIFLFYLTVVLRNGSHLFRTVELLDWGPIRWFFLVLDGWTAIYLRELGTESTGQL